MTETNTKLDEAEFFLEKMRVTNRALNRRSNTPHEELRKKFTFYLSAFLGAFRSVTNDVLCTDFAGRTLATGEKFSTWLEKEVNTWRIAHNDFSYLIAVRNISSHQASIPSQAHITANIILVTFKNPETVKLSPDGRLVNSDGSDLTDEDRLFTTSDGRQIDPSKPYPGQRKLMKYQLNFPHLAIDSTKLPKALKDQGHVPSRPTKDIITVCTDEMVTLRRFVRHCENTFPTN